MPSYEKIEPHVRRLLAHLEGKEILTSLELRMETDYVACLNQLELGQALRVQSETPEEAGARMRRVQEHMRALL